MNRFHFYFLLLFYISTATINAENFGFELCEKIGNNFLQPYCLNKGICYKSKKKSNNGKINDDDLFCQCSSEYTGKRCQTKMNQENVIKSNDDIGKNYYYQTTHLKNPSSKIRTTYSTNSTGTSKTKSHHIKCPDWYNCLNGGTCIVDLILGPKCLCTEEYEGLNCGKAKYCPNMNQCSLRCDFGYKRKFGCDICECKCVNEYNFYTEMKYELINNTQNMTTKFCNKVCPYGYEKNEFDCYKCSCLKQTTTSIVKVTKFPEIACPNDFCQNGEICRYFNSSIYKCSYSQFDCRLYDGQEYIPICIQSQLNEECIEPLATGDCHGSINRYYFDLTDKICKKFIYTGCKANRNNFETLSECTNQCEMQIESFSDDYSIVDEKDNENNNEGEEEEYYADSENKDDDSILEETTLIENKTKLKLTTVKILNNKEVKSTKNIIHESSSSSNIDKTKNLIQDDQMELNKETTISMGCDWVCDLSCQFGYKLDVKTKCYKCDCVELNMTQCGVPCYLKGTKTCVYSNRANSRPTCLCNEGFDGVYCQSYCEKSEETFAMDLEDKYFTSIDKLKQFISDLKNELISSYKFKSNSIKSLKIVIEPRLIIEFTLVNPEMDLNFCTKTYILNNDIRLKNILLLTKFDPNAYDYNYNAANIENDWSASFWNENPQRVATPPNSETNFFSLNSSFFTNTVIYAVIVIAGLIILILVLAVVISNTIKRKREKKMLKIAESRKQDKKRDYAPGYFQHQQRQRKPRNNTTTVNEDDTLTSVSEHKISLIPY